MNPPAYRTSSSGIRAATYQRPSGLMLASVLLLCGCAAMPPEPQPRQDARAIAQAAARARDHANWHLAAERWAHAAARYAALDDWPMAGRAALGEAQARARDGDAVRAGALLEGITAAHRYPPDVRAEAHYQQALFALDACDAERAAAELKRAADLLPPDAALYAALANAQARLAARAGDWVGVEHWAADALAVKAIEPAERANAWRLTAQSRLRRHDLMGARQPLSDALALDHQLARAGATVADLRLMTELALARGDADAAMWQERAQAAAEALTGVSAER